eukprot:CAMPEP_0196641448 /NCGR_PEP_ID=MMETSP1085-20130531/3578_1 /TAXON_ID=41879 ORGANISM="Pycnococcus sp, Strain CCMP1998" /NCGR_SAMPLE_ID=MMETSP1085 /ASSEMBLY_ACC=CAM_ASM_000807 /LENGTH=178 /DNA_ID=CAMNT_0041970695 /DNA_START=83 /DNA_END=615 /DNA_ORIENTATION=+
MRTRLHRNVSEPYTKNLRRLQEVHRTLSESASSYHSAADDMTKTSRVASPPLAEAARLEPKRQWLEQEVGDVDRQGDPWQVDLRVPPDHAEELSDAAVPRPGATVFWWRGRRWISGPIQGVPSRQPAAAVLLLPPEGREELRLLDVHELPQSLLVGRLGFVTAVGAGHATRRFVFRGA